MFGKTGRRHTPAREDVTGGPPARFQVSIGRDGDVTVDGELLCVVPGEAVHAAVLDEMQHRARAGGEPVEALILDRQEEHTVLIEIAPDGSSRMLDRQPYDAPPPPAPLPAPLPEPSAVAGVPSAVSGMPSAVAGVPSVVSVPDELAELVAAIGRSVDAGELERAGALAFRLREHTMRVFGDNHPYVLEALSLEAFVAHRSDNHRLAASTCVGLARIRHLRDDPRARDELTRAVAAWRRLDDVPAAVELGRELLAAWSMCVQRSGPGPDDAALMRLVNRRLHALGTSATDRGSGAA